ncbi:hypothetical protein EC973_003380 [Apophysomyces ossiformis]|uniref:Phospholipid-transporting ATPase n=1 Tax=Apophysomyces ossiformis TaxID=679940 RepID=A0A8H7BXJ0_9FUNG|nr:hypothetical protein EC973_003380 [Apophysomyces ossiformis]
METSNLDGFNSREVNLKVRQALPETAACTVPSRLATLTGAVIQSEQPNSRLYGYNGTLALEEGGKECPLDSTKILLRGAQLRNTDWIYGAVIYTGHETKLMLNSSLMMTLEIVKYVQCIMINNDIDMYYADNDTPAMTKSSSLIEELGQVEYVFSDKTGTLTRNEMKLRRCSVGGISYAFDVEPHHVSRHDNASQGHYIFQHMVNNQYHTPQKLSVIEEFLTALMTCHTVIPENDATGEVRYQASSPDEIALVSGVSTFFNYKFAARGPRTIRCIVEGTEKLYECLNVCEFTSSRRRMSVILKEWDGKIKLYCKGADTVIFDRLTTETDYVEETLLHLEEFASQGLRTLCFAMREIPQEEYDAWAKLYDRAAKTLVNRTEELEKVAEFIEKDMYLLGSTAIEDKLQEGVPETIATLQKANIKVWVLTGDRQETAVNIGYSCKLLSDNMRVILCQSHEQETLEDVIRKNLEEVNNRIQGNQSVLFALVIDGKTLTAALKSEMEKLFYDLAVQCKTVICCRVSPIQKALVVKLVKKYSNSLLLAIGDGANDVSMIQAAHVGVGISGAEGLQASQNADFSIGQFRFLQKLLLVHGSWAYYRLSKMTFYYFYKNVALYFTQFWFAVFNGFSGQTLYESWTIMFFNVVFTILPPMAMGVLDQFSCEKLLYKYPQLYTLGQNNEFFNQKRFWGWILNAIYHSTALVLFMMINCFETAGQLVIGG